MNWALETLPFIPRIYILPSRLAQYTPNHLRWGHFFSFAPVLTRLEGRAAVFQNGVAPAMCYGP